MASDLGGGDVSGGTSRRTFATPDYEIAYSAMAFATSRVESLPPMLRSVNPAACANLVEVGARFHEPASITKPDDTKP